MNVRSALLVAIVAVLAGGAFWLVRGLEGGARRATSTLDSTESEPRETAPSAARPNLAKAPRTVRSARTAIGSNDATDPAPDAGSKPTIVQIQVVRGFPKTGEAVVPSARVEIVETGLENDRPTWDVRAHGETDANGLYSFEVSRSFAAVVRAEATLDGRRLAGSGSPILPTVVPGPLRVHLSEEPEVELRITVLDRDTLRPIVGADVRPRTSEPTTTNALGEFALSIADAGAAAEVCAWIGADGYFPVTWRSWQGTRATLRARAGGDPRIMRPIATGTVDKPVLYLLRSARLAGSLRNAVGARVAGAELRTQVGRSGDPAYAGRTVTADTDEHGRFTFEALPAGPDLSFEVRLRGARVDCDVPFIRLDPGEVRELELFMRGHVQLTGRVLDTDDALVRGGTISIAVDGHEDKGSIRGDGTYYLPFAFAGAGWICVELDAEKGKPRMNHRVPIVIPTTVEDWKFDVRLVPTTSIAGVFLDGAGQRAPAGQLALLGATMPPMQTRSSSGGEFRYDSVPPGEYTLVGRESGGAQRAAEMLVRAGDQNVVLRLPVQGFACGRVLQPNGAAVAKAMVHFQPDGANEAWVECARDGTFRLPSGVGFCWISAADALGHSRYERVSVEAGRETSVGDLVLVPTAELRLVTGRGAPRAHVAVSHDGGSYVEFDVEALCERIIRVPVGSIGLVVSSAGRASTTHSLQVGRDEIVNLPVACGPE